MLPGAGVGAGGGAGAGGGGGGEGVEGVAGAQRVGVTGTPVRADRVGLVGRGRVLGNNSPNSSTKRGVAGLGLTTSSVNERTNDNGLSGVQNSVQSGPMGEPAVGAGVSGRPPSPEWGNWEDADTSVHHQETTTNPGGGRGGTTGDHNRSISPGASASAGTGAGAGADTGMMGSDSSQKGYRRRLDLSAIKLFIGISGPYNLQVPAT